MSVREMAAVREIHRQNLVARFQHREINGHVRLRAAVRLHVDVLAAEKPLGAIDRQLLGGIDILAAAIPTFPRITFRVFVGHHAALSFHHRAAGEIFRGDQFDVLTLAFLFRSNRIKDFGIHFAQCVAVTRRRCGSDGSGVKLARKMVHGIRRYLRRAHRTRADEFALFYKCEHTRQSVFDDARAILVHLAAETDWVRHIAPHRSARFFKFTK